MKKKINRVIVRILLVATLVSNFPGQYGMVSQVYADEAVEGTEQDNPEKEAPEQADTEQAKENPAPTNTEPAKENPSPEKTEAKQETPAPAEQTKDVSANNGLASSTAAPVITSENKTPDKKTAVSENKQDQVSANKNTDKKDDPDKETPSFKQSKTVNGVTVTVEAEDGVFPEGARLSVTSVPSSTTEKAIKDERENDQNVAVSYTFDIKVLDADGKEIQPAEGKSVKVSFSTEEVSDPNLDVNVYHVEEGRKKAEELNVDVSGQTAVAESDGFSYYTVEFTYNNLQYVLNGGEKVALSEILSKVGLVGEAADIEVSSPELFSASKENGKWIITSHKAFSSDEWMKVTIGDITYEIKVTDDPATSGTLDNGLSWTLENGTLTISKSGSGSGAMADWTPPTNNPPWYSNRNNITSIKIEIGVTSIGKGAFSGCSYLTSIDIPSSVTSIGEGAFSSCENLTSIEIPYNVTSIGSHAFGGCKSLTSIEIPLGVTSIGERVFASCTGLTSIEIPYRVTSIGAYAFDACQNLSSITIHSTVTNIGEYAFRNTNINTVNFDGTREQWEAISNHFTATPSVNYVFTATPSPGAGGTVEVTSGTASRVGNSNAFTYTPGQQVTLSANANDGWRFLGWTVNGTSDSDNPEYSFTPDGTERHALVAWFEPFGEVVEVSTEEELRYVIRYVTYNSSLDNPKKVKINGSITLTSDLDTYDRTIEIIGGELNTSDNGLITISQGGCFKMSGGTIIFSGAVHPSVWVQGTFIMDGGTIKSDKVDRNAKGVEVGSHGSFIMNNGKIEDFRESVSVISSGTFTMNGGTINTYFIGVTRYGGTFIMNGGTINSDVYAIDVNNGNIDSITHNRGTLSGKVHALWNNPSDMAVVTFHANNGTGDTNSQIIVPNTETNLRTLSYNGFSYEGHDFKGWAESDAATSATYTDGQLVTLGGNEKKHLYAIWGAIPTTATISFNSNGGTGTMEPQTVTRGEPAALSENKFTYTYHTFKNWNTQADGNGTSYADKATVTLSGNLALFAQWDQEMCTVSFDGNGGSGTMDAQEIPKGVGTSLSENKFTYEGKAFKGWSETLGGSVKYADKAAVTLSSDSLTLYAKWQGPEIATSALDAGKTRNSYSQTLQAVNTSGTVTWTLSSGNLPGGLNLSTDGVISGTPTEIGTFDFTVKVTDENGYDTKDLSITVSEQDKIIYEVTFKVVNGSWNDGTKADKKAVLSKYVDEDKALKLEAGDIPGVGDKPDTDYEKGSWNSPAPDTNTVITADKTYTYTYKKKGPEPEPTPEPTPEPSSGSDQMPEWYKWKKQKNSGSEEEHSSSGSSTPSGTRTPDGFEDLREAILKARAASESTGIEQTVYWDKGTSLPNDVMMLLAGSPKVTLDFSYMYKNYPFNVKIPGKNVIADPSIPWYGPVYLYVTYVKGDKLPTTVQGSQTADRTYTIQKGDTLNKIARKLKVTVDHLKTVNKIKNPNKIKAGMVLKY